MHLETRSTHEGFTIIELIVSMIIVGIAAAIALPNFFGWVEKSHAQEAASTLYSMAIDQDACVQVHPWSVWDVYCLPLVQNYPASLSFNYLVNAQAIPSQQCYNIVATRKNSSNLGNFTISCGGCSWTYTNVTLDYVALCRDPNGNRIVTGGGVYQGLF